MATKRRERFPQIKHVKGTPPVDQAYVIPVVSYPRDGGHVIKKLAIGVVSPAYKSEGKPAPRGIHMTLSQAESFAFAIIARIRKAQRWNREQARKV